MENKTMGPRNLAFVLSEASGKRSVDAVTIASGEGVLEPGSVLGKVTASEKYVFSPNAEVAGKEGAEVATAILGYRVDATDADQKVVAYTADTEVKKPMLLFHASVDDDAKTATKLDQLRAVGIKAR
ncbi:head decoration protein [Roseibium aggregatum]|uniref:head decoration protein n=1 Tax=Roseibium aggregatum TaxID=187304 RepID=UPI001E4B0677|nr:head decoration protein [Roseibium aggregatum]UES51193.1 head decoration protein [Roseibium aggregatum]